MKRIVALLLLVMLLMPFHSFANSGKSQLNIDFASSSKGIVNVKFDSDHGKKIKVLVQKDNIKYYYTIDNSGETESLPLQMGEGVYNVYIYENTSGTSYYEVDKASFNADFTSETAPFLQSVQSIEWDSSMPAIVKAKELTAGLTSDKEKVKAIHNYVISNFSYDYQKAKIVTSGYLPDIDSTYASGKGICYDYSSLFACMLRSVGVPAKLIKGYTSNVPTYHAWNEVFINGSWVVIDSCYDSQMKGFGSAYNMEKPASSYSKMYEY